MDWDTLEYHLPLVDHWLQSGSLYAPDCSRWTNPGNNELLALWTAAPFSGDFLANVNNLPPTILFACSAVGLATRIGLPSTLAHLCGIALTANYVVFDQLTNNKSDVAVAGCFFAAILYVFRFAQGPRRRHLFLAAISLGLLVGIKYYAIGYGALALGTLVLAAAAAKGRRAALEALLIGTIGIALWAGYWYARNFTLTGSPLYPKEFFTFPDLLTQMYPKVASTSFFGNRQADLLPLYIQAIWKMSGPYQLCGFLAVPLSLVWLNGTAMWAWNRPKYRDSAWTRLTLAILVGGTSVLLGVTPFAVENVPGTLNQLRAHQIRYGMCFLSIATMAFTFVVYDCLDKVRYCFQSSALAKKSVTSSYIACGWLHLLGFILAATSLCQIVYLDRRLQIDSWFCWFFAMDTLFVAVGGFMIVTSWPRLRRRLIAPVLASMLTASALVGDSLSQHWHHGFKAQYEYVEMFNIGTLSFPPSNPLKPVTICVLENPYYPYFGSHREHRVCQPVFAPSTDSLMDYFHKKKVEVIVDPRDPFHLARRQFKGMKNCLSQYRGLFRQSFKNDVVVIYQFLCPSDHVHMSENSFNKAENTRASVVK